MDETNFFEDKTLERELREAMRSEEEISLFRVVRDNLQVKDELANSKSVQVILSGMWSAVADFFDAICAADTIAGLAANDELVIRHARMRANFDAVAAINQSFKDARLAEEQLTAEDLDRQQNEDIEP